MGVQLGLKSLNNWSNDEKFFVNDFKATSICMQYNTTLKQLTINRRLLFISDRFITAFSNDQCLTYPRNKFFLWGVI